MPANATINPANASTTGPSANVVSSFTNTSNVVLKIVNFNDNTTKIILSPGTICNINGHHVNNGTDADMQLKLKDLLGDTAPQGAE